MAPTQSAEANPAPLEWAGEFERKLQEEHHAFSARESRVSHLDRNAVRTKLWFGSNRPHHLVCDHNYDLYGVPGIVQYHARVDTEGP